MNNGTERLERLLTPRNAWITLSVLAVCTVLFGFALHLFGFGGATNHAPPVIATMEPTPDESLVAVDASTTTLPGTVAPPETTIAG